MKTAPSQGRRTRPPPYAVKGKRAERQVEIQGRVQKVGVVVMGEGVVVRPEPGDLAQEHADVFAEKLHERQVHEAGGRHPRAQARARQSWARGAPRRHD